MLLIKILNTLNYLNNQAMLDKDDSLDVSNISDQSDSESVINLLNEKLPDVEEILTNSIKIIEEENNRGDNSLEEKVDLVHAFNEILEIYELTSNAFVNRRDRDFLI